MDLINSCGMVSLAGIADVVLVDRGQVIAQFPGDHGQGSPGDGVEGGEGMPHGVRLDPGIPAGGDGAVELEIAIEAAAMGHRERDFRAEQVIPRLAGEAGQVAGQESLEPGAEANPAGAFAFGAPIGLQADVQHPAVEIDPIPPDGDDFPRPEPGEKAEPKNGFEPRVRGAFHGLQDLVSLLRATVFFHSGGHGAGARIEPGDGVALGQAGSNCPGEKALDGPGQTPPGGRVGEWGQESRDLPALDRADLPGRAHGGGELVESVAGDVGGFWSVSALGALVLQVAGDFDRQQAGGAGYGFGGGEAFPDFARLRRIPSAQGDGRWPGAVALRRTVIPDAAFLVKASQFHGADGNTCGNTGQCVSGLGQCWGGMRSGLETGFWVGIEAFRMLRIRVFRQLSGVEFEQLAVFRRILLLSDCQSVKNAGNALG